jgi:hypothetical protein
VVGRTFSISQPSLFLFSSAMRSPQLLTLATVAITKLSSVLSWTFIPSSVTSRVTNFRHHIKARNNERSIILLTKPLSSSSVASNNADGVDLSQEEWEALRRISQQASATGSSLEDVLLQAVPTLHPRLILKLRQADSAKQSLGESTSEDQALFATISQTLQSVLNSRLVAAKQVLETMLQAGELRKLDAAIGKAARQGQLDAAFFTILQKNLEDAVDSDKIQQQPHDENNDNTDSNKAPTASRAQILQHIRTRCQEEVEKEIPPGLALLNKLLRTEQSSIRANQLKHYLCPQPPPPIPGVETKQDSDTPEVILIPPTLLVDAVAQTVQQIRTLETAGATTRESAAAMVESCRQVAKEARIVLAKEYGLGSSQLQAFEDALMPVFRPASSDSPYIQGI